MSDVLSDSQAITRLVFGDFAVTNHAIESFRIRVANVSKGKAVALIRQQITEMAKENGLAGVERNDSGNGWIVKVVHPRYKYRYWAAVAEDRLEPGRLIVTTLYRPGRVQGFISIKDHNHHLDNLRRRLLEMEDKYFELTERFIRKGAEDERSSTGDSTHCECCSHSLAGDAGDRPPFLPTAPELGEEEEGE